MATSLLQHGAGPARQPDGAAGDHGRQHHAHRADLLHDGERSKLLLDLATNEGIQVYPREVTDYAEALPDDDYWQRVAQHIRTRFGPETQIAWGVNQVPGFWVSFQIEKELYWLVFEREQIGLTGGIEWLGWGATALLLSLVGAAVSVGFVNRPLSRLARAAQVLSRGETPAPLPEQGPLEIRDLNASFNRMARTCAKPRPTES